MKQLSWLFTSLIALLYACRASSEKQSSKESLAIADSTTAVRIAEAAFVEIYGKQILDYRPFLARLDSQGAIWFVQGTLRTEDGGVPYARIRLKDGFVTELSHSK